MRSTYIEFPAQGRVEVKEEEIRDDHLEPMEVLVRNEASIISAGTELAALCDTAGNATYPKRPGYGSVGVILAKGEGVTDFDVGDRVFYAGKHASVQRFTHGENHQWSYLFPVPEGLDPVDATVGCMAQIALTAPNLTELRLGDTVAVFGLGTVGNLAAQIYSIQGARVLGVDPVSARCETARMAGIEETIDAAPEEQVQAVLDLTGGSGAEVTVDAVGHSAVIESCVRSTALFGQILLLGSPRGTHTRDMTGMLWDIHLNGKVMRGAHMWHFPVQQTRETQLSVEWNFATVFELIRSGKLKVKELISHVIQPGDAAEAYDGLQNRRDVYTGVIINWQ
jgi:2-desacetyl-2-hydroxyethyl bacteriochlorophyllide A dehydrogenase